MDRKSTEIAFSLDGAGTKTFEWQDDDTSLIVKTSKSLSAWTVYGWTVTGKALSKNGVPLEKEVSGQFTTDIDKVYPQVTEISPMLRSNEKWLETGSPFETGLGPNQSIGIFFNKPMDKNDLLKAVRFDPSLSGRTELTGDASLVYIPDRAPEINTTYTLIVSSDTKDASGLKMGADHVVYFKADIPFLEVSSITIGAGAGIADFKNKVFDATINSLKTLRLTISFSLPFDEEAKLDTAFRVSLSPFFPATIPPIALKSASWTGEQLCLEWEALEVGDEKIGADTETYFYKLLIPGSKNGIINGNGSYLEEDNVMYVKTIK
jgi:hypothetical protein